MGDSDYAGEETKVAKVELMASINPGHLNFSNFIYKS
jgi:hypothetical protein